MIILIGSTAIGGLLGDVIGSSRGSAGIIRAVAIDVVIVDSRTRDSSVDTRTAVTVKNVAADFVGWAGTVQAIARVEENSVVPDTAVTIQVIHPSTMHRRYIAINEIIPHIDRRTASRQVNSATLIGLV